MSKQWPTEEKDMQVAQLIMQEYASRAETESLGLLEIEVNQSQKKMNFRLSGWVVLLAKHFNSLYGASQGDFVTRKILSRYMVQKNTVH